MKFRGGNRVTMTRLHGVSVSFAPAVLNDAIGFAYRKTFVTGAFEDAVSHVRPLALGFRALGLLVVARNVFGSPGH